LTKEFPDVYNAVLSKIYDSIIKNENEYCLRPPKERNWVDGFLNLLLEPVLKVEEIKNLASLMNQKKAPTLKKSSNQGILKISETK